MDKILFVCLGNICRSPMAEAIMKKKIKKKGLSRLFSCYSVGTAAYHIGKSPDSRTLKVLNKNGIIYSHRAEQLDPYHLENYKYVFAMDEENLKNINELAVANGIECNAKLFRESYSTSSDVNVPDPYYGGEEGFKEIYDILDSCCDNFLEGLVSVN